MGLTAPMYTDQMAFISKDGVKSMSELEGKKVGTVDGYLWVDDVRRSSAARSRCTPPL